MTGAEPDSASRIRYLAERQLADYDRRSPGTVFAEGESLSLNEGYKVQSAVAELRRRRGEQIIGYKVGCTSPAIRAQLGIDHCVTGRLFHTERHDSPVTLSRRDFANLAVEGELAVELSRPPDPRDFLPDGIPPFVERVFPVIELHHQVLRGAQPTAGELVAHNAIHAGFVEGQGSHGRLETEEPALEITINGRKVGTCAGSALIETVRTSLHWLSGVLQSRGEPLQAGQLVLTGSIPPLFAIRDSCCVTVSAPPLGRVEATFVA